MPVRIGVSTRRQSSQVSPSYASQARCLHTMPVRPGVPTLCRSNQVSPRCASQARCLHAVPVRPDVRSCVIQARCLHTVLVRPSVSKLCQSGQVFRSCAVRPDVDRPMLFKDCCHRMCCRSYIKTLTGLPHVTAPQSSEDASLLSQNDWMTRLRTLCEPLLKVGHAGNSNSTDNNITKVITTTLTTTALTTI